ncbi:hypothetical protein [Bacillus thuringiensis]|uniref:hypothetical protein n=1 Tax=Bacillus thuringiensis TaxID=1428 RepID=UPI00115581A2|nr:hypothetical protein [Bacillus thuringiensis]
MDLKCNQCRKRGNHNGICKECFEKILVRNGEKEGDRGLIKLADLEPGKLFRFGETVGFKSEYRSGGAIEAFIVGSGEMFWGGTSTADKQRELMVEPIDLKELV